jgi:hypothetical protein
VSGRLLPAAIWAFAMAALLPPGAALAQNGPISGVTTSATGQPRGNINVAVCSDLATTGASVTSNVATLAFASNPQTLGFVNGATLTVYGFTGGDTYLNTSAAIVSTSSTTVSYALVHANASAATNGFAYQKGNSTQACAGLAALTTDNTAATASPNPFTSDGLGNYLTFAAPAYYRVQIYGAGVSTFFYATAVACVPNNTVNCGVLGGTPNTWTALQTFSAGISSGGTGTFTGAWGGAPTLSGLWTFNAGLTSAGPNALSGGGTTFGSWTHAATHTFNGGAIFGISILPGSSGSIPLGSPLFPFSTAVIGSAANMSSSQTSLATANRTVSWPDASGTVSLAAVEYCGATTGATQACAKTVQTLPYIAWGDVTLNTATSQSISTLPFTDGLFSCTGSDLTTPAGIVSFNTYVSASVTIQESGGVNTDHLRYMCVGR